MQTLRKKLLFYQRMMMIAKTAGDMEAHEIYRRVVRLLESQIKEKTA